MAPRSSRSRDTVAWVATTPSSASRSTNWAWLCTTFCSMSFATRCCRCGLFVAIDAVPRQEGQQASRRVHAVLGLRPHPALGPIDDLVGHLLVAVGRQAVQEDGAGG